MSEPGDLPAALIKSVVDSDTAEQERLFTEVDLALSTRAAWSPEWFQALCDGLRDPAVKRSTDSARLLKLFEYDRDLLDDAQRTRLAAVLEEVYPGYEDPAALILILELLVAGDADGARFMEFLSAQAGAAEENARALVPYGLKLAAKRFPGHRERALALARRLAADASPEVRNEAQAALRHIERR